MFSPHRIPANSHKRKQKILNREHDVERPQMTSNDLKRTQLTSKEEVTTENVKSLKSKSKINLKDGSVHKNIEINGQYLDEYLHKNNL